jgi:hypothetical protein
MANPNWARWIHSSVATALKQVAIDDNLAVLVEGIDTRTAAFMEAADRVEIRVNGPFTRPLPGGVHDTSVDVNVLVTSHMGGTVRMAYTHDEILGLYHEAMDGHIAIYRYGTGPDDDQSLLGCLTPRPGKNSFIRVLRFGQLDTTVLAQQGMVDARYIMQLSE